MLFIPLRETTIPRDAFLYYRGDSPTLAVQSLIDAQLQTLLHNAILEDVYQLEPSVYHSIETTGIRLHTQDSATGRESFAKVKNTVALVLAILMVAALLLFGTQVMRSVQEEKQNRVAEVLATTVRPMQLLVGKTLGIALTALTQLLLWTMLTTLCIHGIQASSPQLFDEARQQKNIRSVATKGVEATAQHDTTVQLVDDTVQGLTAIRLPLVVGMFLLWFLMGYLLYGALTAALAARLESDAAVFQWMLLIGSPMLIVLILSPLLLRAPTSALATWLTLIPFTAPATVMLRLPFGLPLWQTGTAIALSLLCFALAAGWAARSYRRHLLD